MFSPEHGLFGVKDTTKIGEEVDAATHLPVVSLYGAKDEQRRPSMESLKNLDAVVIDLQDAGVRFYTYETVVGYFLEAAAKAHIEIIVLDRPNPIGGVAVQGPVSDKGVESYTDYMPLPIREGMTLGELALYFNGERLVASGTSANVRVPIKAQLTVVAMRNWARQQYFDETGLKWINPSPNLRSAAANVVYPGVELRQSTNMSVGRGTEMPFLHIGAPYIDSAQLAAYLTARKIPGVSFAPASFSVAEDANHYPFHGKTLPGISFTVTDKRALDSPELGIELISALHHLYPEFTLAKAERSWWRMRIRCGRWRTEKTRGRLRRGGRLISRSSSSGARPICYINSLSRCRNSVSNRAPRRCRIFIVSSPSIRHNRRDGFSEVLPHAPH